MRIQRCLAIHTNFSFKAKNEDKTWQACQQGWAGIERQRIRWVKFDRKTDGFPKQKKRKLLNTGFLGGLLILLSWGTLGQGDPSSYTISFFFRRSIFLHNLILFRWPQGTCHSKKKRNCQKKATRQVRRLVLPKVWVQKRAGRVLSITDSSQKT